MLVLDDFQEWTRRIESLSRERERVKGALDQLYHRLKQEFDCRKRQEAEDLYARLEKKERQLSDQYAEDLDRFRAKYPSVLEKQGHPGG